MAVKDYNAELGTFNTDMAEAIKPQAAAVADIATVDATDLATAITLANANKAKINALLASLRAAGVIAT